MTLNQVIPAVRWDMINNQNKKQPEKFTEEDLIILVFIHLLVGVVILVGSSFIMRVLARQDVSSLRQIKFLHAKDDGCWDKEGSIARHIHPWRRRIATTYIESLPRQKHKEVWRPSRLLVASVKTFEKRNLNYLAIFQDIKHQNQQNTTPEKILVNTHRATWK